MWRECGTGDFGSSTLCWSERQTGLVQVEILEGGCGVCWFDFLNSSSSQEVQGVDRCVDSFCVCKPAGLVGRLEFEYWNCGDDLQILGV